MLLDYLRLRRGLLAKARAKHLAIPRGFTVLLPAAPGTPCRRLIAEVQRAYGLPVTGIFDRLTRALVCPPQQRARIVAAARWGVRNSIAIHYSQGALRMAAVHKPFSLPLATDCSGFATLCHAWSDAPDPNGRGYDGYGFTGTLLDHLPHIPLAAAQPADLVVFGAYPGTHVVIITETGRDPLVVSHGSESGPLEWRLSAEAVYHPGQPLTCLRSPAIA